MEKENSILKIIADNPSLLEELRKLFEKEFEIPKDSGGLPVVASDELLGQYVRARIVGYKAIENVFREIEKYKIIPDKPETKNPAR